MAYPDDKETFRRVINQDLPAEPGTVLDQGDQNLPADFLERLQDTFGYNIKMGYANVKEFFDNIVSQFAGIKKTEIIIMQQGDAGGAKTQGQITEFRQNLNLVSTDIIFFQVNFFWRGTTSGSTVLRMSLLRINTPFGPVQNFSGIGQNKRLSTNYNYVLTNPTPGNVSFAMRITAHEGAQYWDAISFTAIKISL